MVDNMNKKRIVISVIILLAVIIAVAGLSYAFYAPEIGVNVPSTSELVTPNLSLNVIDGNEINIEHVLPGQKVIKTFSVQNTGTGSITYQVALTDVLNELVRYPDLVYTITSTNNGGSATNQVFPTTDALLLRDVEIAPNTTQEYTMEITFKNLDLDQSIDCDKTIAGTIQIYDQYAPKIYGIRRDLENSSSAWERTRDSVGLVANAQVGDTPVVNDFDDIYPWHDIYSYNYDSLTGQEVGIIGDDNFKFDGSNGMVLTYIPEFYYHRYRSGGYEYIEISRDYIEGFQKSNSFSIGRYASGYDGTKILSQSGVPIKTAENVQWFREATYALGPKFTQLDQRLFMIQMLYLVEYANYDSQSSLGVGVTAQNTGARKVVRALTEENAVVITYYYHLETGYYVNVYDSSGQIKYLNIKILGIDEYRENGSLIGRKITLDLANDQEVLLDEDIRLVAHPSGICDFLGMKSGARNKAKGNDIIYRGIENPFGNIWYYVDGITSINYHIYICNNPRSYVTEQITDCYMDTGIDLPTTGSNTYLRSLSLVDGTYSHVFLPESFGGTASTYVADQSSISSSKRAIAYGGDIGATPEYTGFFRYDIQTASGRSYSRGSRVILDHN